MNDLRLEQDKIKMDFRFLWEMNDKTSKGLNPSKVVGWLVLWHVNPCWFI